MIIFTNKCQIKIPLNRLVYLTFLTAALFSQLSHAQVSGTVFRDFNADGTRQTGSPIDEIGIGGITVTAYDATGASAGSATSAPDGTYSIPSVSGALRIEFTDLQAGDYSSLSGGTSVQFVTAPATAINYAVNYPSDYCQASPNVAIPTMRNGAASGSSIGFVAFPYSSTGTTIPTNSLATFAEVGAVWGQAYQSAKKRSFLTAFTKRHSGFGPEGIGGVYVIDQSSGSSVVSSFSLANVTPANGGTINLGTIDRTSSADFTLGGSSSPNIDLDAFPKVGRTSFGDAELSEDGNTLWIANLNQTALISVDLSGATLPGTVNQYVLTGLPTCNAGQFRIFGLRSYRGYLYVGGVCSGENSGTTADLWAYVLRYDPNNIAAGYTTILSFDLDYPREGIGGGGETGWQPWSITWNSAFNNQNYRYPEAILSNIDFAANGDMVLALMDRHGHQVGFANYPAESGAASPSEEGLAMGDILHTCYQSGVWVLEGSNAACVDNDTNPLSGQSTTDGPAGAGEYYYGDYYSDNGTDVGHDEVSTGSILILRGSNEVLSTTYDPASTGGWQTQGVQRYSTQTGALLNAYRVVENEDVNTFGKAAGLGDIEPLCNPAPLEIGNRIWDDTDTDGIQDANETGINGITVQLYDGAALVATTITANGGQWYFNNSNVNQNGATELKPNTTYTIRVLNTAFPSGQVLSTANVGGAGQPDVRDSDAILVSGNAEIAYTTGSYGQSDHTLDIGFMMEPCDLTAAANGTNVSCNGGNNGTASATPSGNIGAVTYLWSNSSTTASISNLVAGAYTVTISQSATCTATASYEVTQPTAINLTCNKTDVTSNGGADGSASVTAIGGTSPYTYLWNTGETTATISNKTAATYTVVVTDNNGCTASCQSVIVQPIFIVVNSIDVLCFGASTGTIDITASGGTGIYTYDWADITGSSDSEDRTNLAAGTYNITITDSAGNTATETITIAQPTSAITVATTSSTNVLCFDGTTGAINITASGGTGAFTYDWADITGTSNSEDRTNLAAGSYTVTVTDANACTESTMATITQPTAINIVAVKTDVLCFGASTGAIDITVSGGSNFYAYDWADIAGTNTIAKTATDLLRVLIP
jgi:hypothetical protein